MQSEQNLIVDSDVQAVIAFMQGNIPAARLVAVANGIASIAPLLWGQYQPESVQALRLVASPISLDDRHIQSVASE
jgi:hypothetical protein